MAKQNVNPDALASKTFIATMLGAILYITVVFIFVIAGNDKLGDEGQETRASQWNQQENNQAAAQAAQGH